MKRILNALISGLGALALVAVLAPSDASAQQCRSSSSYGQRSSHSYGYRYAPTYRTTRHYAAPVRRSRGYTSARVIVNPHYGNGSIYYRSHSYVRPPVRYYRSQRQVRRSRGRCDYR